MARTKKTNSDAGGEQLELIDVAPKNAKQILQVARAYKRVQADRIGALEEEKKLKDKILSEVHKANLSPLEGGKIRFRCDGVIITVTPRDELVQVKEDEGD